MIYDYMNNKTLPFQKIQQNDQYLNFFNMALCDSGCTKTVCEETWLQHYLHYLSFDKWTQIEICKSNSSFKFGESKLAKSFKNIKIPAIITVVQAKVLPDVVEYDIPLLLSKEAMKKVKIQIDFQKDKCISPKS